jgi:hypothetical protein
MNPKNIYICSSVGGGVGGWWWWRCGDVVSTLFGDVKVIEETGLLGVGVLKSVYSFSCVLNYSYALNVVSLLCCVGGRVDRGERRSMSLDISSTEGGSSLGI